jgi:hypothetical protein
VAEDPAVRAPLDEELVFLGPLEEEPVVLGEGGTGPPGPVVGAVVAAVVAAVVGRGLNLRIRNRMVATSSPCWSVYSSRVVTKCPTPRPVVFSGDTASMTDRTSSTSPGTSGRT